jgi:DNA polymerase-3 subunit epsilon
MREIVLDTETTGLDPRNGDRIVEIGAIELINHVPTGRADGVFHQYINPERDMPAEAAAVHGLTDAFLADKPVFAEIVGAFLEFIGDAPLIIHNAPFDMGFLNAELGRLGFPALPATRAVDTVALARQMFPGAQASLDALCRRYGIDNANRTLHGALLDAELLAEVYLELRGGRQPGLVLAGQPGAAASAAAAGPAAPRRRREPRPHAPTPEELAAHAAFLDKLSQPIWRM